MPDLFKIKDGRPAFWQWDQGRQLLVGDEICTEVHFCNGTSDGSLKREIYELDGERVVNVPDVILQTARSFSVYGYVKDESGGYTKCAVRFSVHPQTKPADYIYTEDEVKTWDDLDERIQALEQGGTGGVTEEQIVDVVQDYMAENPVEIPKKVSAFENDAGYLTEHQDLSGYAKTEDIPEALPNPHALHLTGAVEATYDGSEAVEVVIPQGVTDSHINSLIDAKLGVIENGSY